MITNSASRRFRFGLHVNTSDTGESWAALARRAESVGFDIVTMPDHLTDGIPQFAPIPALTAIAAATERLRIGTWVLCNDYHHPVVLAKEAATIDFLSNGRFEFGLGAGWQRAEYESAGFRFDRPGARIARLRESIELIQLLWSNDVVDFAGEYYTVHGLRSVPRPVQRPHPPIAIGGGGPRILALAAQIANIVGINFNLASGQHADDVRSKTVSGADSKVEIVRNAAGVRFPDVELQTRILFAIKNDNRHKDRSDFASKQLGVPLDQLAQNPHVLLGNEDDMVDTLERRRARLGISYITFSQADFDDVSPVVSRLGGQ